MILTLVIIAISVLACSDHRPRSRPRRKEWEPQDAYETTRTRAPDNCDICGSPFIGPPYIHKSSVDGHETWMWNHPKVRMQPGCPSSFGCRIPAPKKDEES